MERKKTGKGHLKRRILFNISFVLVLAMVVSTGVSCYYFQKVVREQKISDESAKLQQVANQINFMTEDIRSFSKSIVVDDTIQRLIGQTGQATVFQQIKTKDEVAKQLIFYNSMRTCIGSSIIELSNGQRYSSSTINGLVNEYLNEKLETGELYTFKGHEEWTYSNPYLSRDSGSVQQVVCIRTQMMDIEHFGVRKGTLYLEIYLDYFIKQIKAYEADYDSVCLLGNEGEILYKKDAQEQMGKLLEESGEEITQGSHKVKGGYLLCQDIDGAGWKLCTLVTNRYLWARSSFVIRFFVLSFLILLVLILATVSLLLEKITRPIAHLSHQMESVDYEHLEGDEIVRTGDEIQTLYECYGKMLGEIRSGMEARMEYEKQKKDMEFDIMLSQINPHYLYNVLNTVVYLATAEKNKNIVKIVNALIYTLQETLKVGEHNIETTIEQELELMDCYVTIQGYRYPDRFRVRTECDETLKGCIVPKTIIQPIVENAILHGILPGEEAGTVTVRIMRRETLLSVEIEDDGVGMPAERLKLFENREELVYEENGRKHIGISNIRDRIRYLYGAPYGMWIQNTSPHGTLVTLHLPLVWPDGREL